MPFAFMLYVQTCILSYNMNKMSIDRMIRILGMALSNNSTMIPAALAAAKSADQVPYNIEYRGESILYTITILLCYWLPALRRWVVIIK